MYNNETLAQWQIPSLDTIIEYASKRSNSYLFYPSLELSRAKPVTHPSNSRLTYLSMCMKMILRTLAFEEPGNSKLTFSCPIRMLLPTLWPL